MNKSLIKIYKNFDMFDDYGKFLYRDFSGFFKIFPTEFERGCLTPFPFETEYGYQFSLL